MSEKDFAMVVMLFLAAIYFGRGLHVKTPGLDAKVEEPMPAPRVPAPRLTSKLQKPRQRKQRAKRPKRK